MENENRSEQLLLRKGIMNFSVQHVVAEYLDCQETLKCFAARLNYDPDKYDPVKGKLSDDVRCKHQIITQCDQKLNEAREALLPTHWWKSRKIFVAWRLIHRLGEDFILLMNCAELAAQGRKILHDLKTSPLPDIVRLDWISQVEEKQKRLEEQLRQLKPSNEPCIEPGTAEIYRTITNIINDNVDDRFWEIWSHRLLLFTYVILLALGFIWFLSELAHPGGFSLCFASVLLFGAMGGIASGIMTTEQEYMAKGHFWLPLLSCPAVRMIQGALAAMIVFWMIQCHYFIRINPPLERYNKAYLCMTSPVWRDPVFIKNSPRHLAAPESHSPARKDPKHDQSALAQTRYSSAKKDPMLDLNAPPGKQIYLYFLVLFAAGFMGDKLLKFLSDKVTAKLFAEAEKTKEPKK